MYPGIHPIQIFACLLLLFHIVVIIDCIRTGKLDWRYKIIWLLVILFAAPIGSFIYFVFKLIGYVRRKSEARGGETHLSHEIYTRYDQGYQSSQQPEHPENVPEPDEIAPQYELPQAKYPEMKMES